MDISIDSRSGRRQRAGYVPAAGRWARDARTPSLRLTPAAVEPPPVDMTAEFSIVDVEHVAPSRPVITLHPVHARETMPFMARTTACPYLECRSSNRRCLSADPAPISLERQVRHCLGKDHRSCKYYRKARGLPAVPPGQAAFYTAAVVVIVMLVFVAGLG